jgi:hypothetical protein
MGVLYNVYDNVCLLRPSQATTVKIVFINMMMYCLKTTTGICGSTTDDNLHQPFYLIIGYNISAWHVFKERRSRFRVCFLLAFAAVQH